MGTDSLLSRYVRPGMPAILNGKSMGIDRQSRQYSFVFFVSDIKYIWLYSIVMFDNWERVQLWQLLDFLEICIPVKNISVILHSRSAFTICWYHYFCMVWSCEARNGWFNSFIQVWRSFFKLTLTSLSHAMACLPLYSALMWWKSGSCVFYQRCYIYEHPPSEQIPQ